MAFIRKEKRRFVYVLFLDSQFEHEEILNIISADMEDKIEDVERANSKEDGG